jgi:hypothetical protein
LTQSDESWEAFFTLREDPVLAEVEDTGAAINSVNKSCSRELVIGRSSLP